MRVGNPQYCGLPTLIYPVPAKHIHWRFTSESPVNMLSTEHEAILGASTHLFNLVLCFTAKHIHCRLPRSSYPGASIETIWELHTLTVINS